MNQNPIRRTRPCKLSPFLADSAAQWVQNIDALLGPQKPDLATYTGIETIIEVMRPFTGDTNATYLPVGGWRSIDRIEHAPDPRYLQMVIENSGSRPLVGVPMMLTVGYIPDRPDWSFFLLDLEVDEPIPDDDDSGNTAAVSTLMCRRKYLTVCKSNPWGRTVQPVGEVPADLSAAQIRAMLVSHAASVGY